MSNLFNSNHECYALEENGGFSYEECMCPSCINNINEQHEANLLAMEIAMSKPDEAFPINDELLADNAEMPF